MTEGRSLGQAGSSPNRRTNGNQLVEGGCDCGIAILLFSGKLASGRGDPTTATAEETIEKPAAPAPI